MSFKIVSKAKNNIMPGLSACIAIAIFGKLLGAHFPSVGGGTIAIVLGILLKNTFLKSEAFEEGTKFAETNILALCIMLLGATVSSRSIVELGFSGVVFIVLQMTITVFGVFYVGRKLGFSENFGLLMACGNAVCGSSAIGATAPAIDADDSEKNSSIAVVNLTGTVLMLLLPLIAKYLFSLEVEKTSALLGGILQSVGQVVASGSIVGEDVKNLATIFKIVRIIFLVFVVLGMGAFKRSRSGNSETTNSAPSSVKIPWYIVGFFAMCILYTSGLMSEELSSSIGKTSGALELIALAGIGMRVDLKSLAQQGRKISLYALLVAAIQIISAIFLIFSIF